MDEGSLSVDLDEHLGEHLGLAQLAEEQLPPSCSREGSQGAPAAVLVPVGTRQTIIFTTEPLTLRSYTLSVCVYKRVVSGYTCALNITCKTSVVGFQVQVQGF